MREFAENEKELAIHVDCQLCLLYEDFEYLDYHVDCHFND